MSQNLSELLAAGAHDVRAPVLSTPEGAVTTYGDLERDVARWASGFRDAGVERGDRVLYQVEKSPAVIALHLALLRSGAIQVPVNPAYSDTEVAALLGDAEPAVVIRDPARAALSGRWQSLTLDATGQGSARELTTDHDVDLPSVHADDGAALLYTSGTTGRPKGALLTHANLVHNAEVLVAEWGFTKGDALLHMLPLFHTHGLFVASHCVLAAGASMVLLPAFDVSAVLDAMARCTVVMGVPTHYSRLLSDERFDAELATGIRLFVSGSAPMPVQLHETFTARTGKRVLERYGMTETSMLTSNPLRGVRKPGTVGRPLMGVDVRVATTDTDAGTGVVGQVEVRGPNVFGGYWRRRDLASETFTDDGFFRTGDLGRFDDDGYLELVGRSKDLVISGGLNVYPRDVEEVLDAITGVHESAVFGVPDSDLGEQVVAAVVGEPGTAVDPEAVRRAARARLAGYKVPRRIIVVDELPRNAMGKVQKSVLRAVAMDTPA